MVQLMIMELLIHTHMHTYTYICTYVHTYTHIYTHTYVGPVKKSGLPICELVLKLVTTVGERPTYIHA